jgi:hypothetical protein
VILGGRQGGGKTEFVNIFGRLFGASHFYSTANPEDLFGKHAEGCVQKLLVAIEETEGKRTYKLESLLKAFITDPQITLNAKNLRPIVIANLAFLFIISNKHNPVPIDIASGDRRYNVSRALGHFAERASFWDKARPLFRSPLFLRCLYDRLNNKDVSKLNFRAEREAAMTPSYKAMAMQYAPIEARYIEHILQQLVRSDEKSFNNDSLTRKIDANKEDSLLFVPSTNNQKSWSQEITMNKKQVYTDFKIFAREIGNFQSGFPSAQTVYSKMLTELELPLSEVKGFNGLSGADLKKSGYDCFRFMPSKMYKHLKKRKLCTAIEVLEDAGEVIKSILDSIVDRVVEQSEEAAIDRLFS